MKAEGIGRWLAESRLGRAVFVLGALAIVAIAVYLATREEVGRQTSAIVKRVNVIEAADPCVQLAQAKAPTHPLRRRCVLFLNGLGSLISLQLTCDILDVGGYPCPRPGSGVVAEGGGHLQPAHAGQPTSPAKGPANHDHSPTTGKPAGKDADSPDEAPTADEPSPAPEPGSSGAGASDEHGLDVCVELAQSACVHVDAGMP